MLSPTAPTPRSSLPGPVDSIATGTASSQIFGGFAAFLSLEAPSNGDGDVALAHGMDNAAQPASGKVAGKNLPDGSRPSPAPASDTRDPGTESGDTAKEAVEPEVSGLQAGAALPVDLLALSASAPVPDPMIMQATPTPASPALVEAVGVEAAPAKPARRNLESGATSPNPVAAMPVQPPHAAAPEVSTPLPLQTDTMPGTVRIAAVDPDPATMRVAQKPAPERAAADSSAPSAMAVPEAATGSAAVVAQIAVHRTSRTNLTSVAIAQPDTAGTADKVAPLPATPGPTAASTATAPASTDATTPGVAPPVPPAIVADRPAPLTAPTPLEAIAGADLQPLLALRDPLAMPTDPASTAPRAGIQTLAAPHDFAALVDRLVEAREAAAPHMVRAAIGHADFGIVTFAFQQTDGALAVRIASNDPAFAPAVQAAAATSTDSGATPQREGNQQQGQGALTGQPHQQHGSAREGGRDPAPRSTAPRHSEASTTTAGEADNTADDGLYA